MSGRVASWRGLRVMEPRGPAAQARGRTSVSRSGLSRERQRDQARVASSQTQLRQFIVGTPEVDALPIHPFHQMLHLRKAGYAAARPVHGFGKALARENEIWRNDQAIMDRDGLAGEFWEPFRDCVTRDDLAGNPSVMRVIEHKDRPR